MPEDEKKKPEPEAEGKDDGKQIISPGGEVYIKHPLQNPWTMWFFRNEKAKNYLDNQVPITTFRTVEDFWALWNHIQLASQLMAGWDYMLFKEGIRPNWEDPANKTGGRWLLTTQRPARTSGELDGWWLELVLCLIGEGFDEHSDDVNGAVINIRPKGDKISIWTRDINKESTIRAIGRTIKDRLSLGPRVMIHFQTHIDSANKHGSSTRAMITI